MSSTLKFSLFSLLFNAVFCTYHIVSGIITHSWWLFTIGIYYAVLSILRFVVLLGKKNNRFITRFSGVMLMLLSVPLVGAVILAVIRDRGIVMHEIVMITMAAYSFTKITFAIINLVKARKKHLSQTCHFAKHLFVGCLRLDICIAALDAGILWGYVRN